MPGFQTKGIVEVPLEVFGGRVTEMAAVDLPEGVSPDEQDNTYLPGAVLTRPCLEKILTNAPAQTTCTYQKSFVTPTGAIKNLYLFSNGQLYWEDPINAPGVGNLLFTGPPGSYAKSATMFGREFIALNDTLHGATVPLQWDGTNLDRVTQDGPGACPTVQSIPLPSSTLGPLPAWQSDTAYTVGQQVVVVVSSAPYDYTCTVAGTSGGTEPTATSGTTTDGTVTWSITDLDNSNTLTRLNNTVTAQVATPHGLEVGYQAQISNVPDSNSTNVNQSLTSPNGSGQTAYSGWSFNSGEWRSNFNPGTSPLSGFIVSGFNFNIPSNATILGVTVSFEVAAQSATTGTVNEVALWNSAGQVGTLKSPATPIPAASSGYLDASYGSPADTWGASLTPTIINTPGIGFAISITCDSIRVFLSQPFIMTVYYTLSGSGTVAIISSIVIDNETSPGLALITTEGPHGLAPEEYVSIVGVEPGTVANVTAAEWSSGTTTITTDTSHNLTVGALVQVAGVTTSTGSTTFSFNGNFVVTSIPSPNQFTYLQTPITATDPDVIDATANTGAVTLAWPLPATSPTPTYFQVESTPTTTTFYVPITYADGTWTSGTVGFMWEGTFYVTAVLSATEFQYQQYGPNGSTSATGTVTPFGQAAPGFHLMRCTFLTREGAVLKSSPYVKFIANGGQYLQVSNLPIGPENIVARIIEFTGADGAYFFYIPATPQINGQIVGTATQINDNTTTEVTLDFSDNTLFAGLATSIPGNDLNSQIVLDGALGFGQYSTRLVTYGQRNRIQNFLNLSFDGGYLPSASTIPAGWTPGANIGELYTNPSLPPSSAWLIESISLAESGLLSQSAYLDAYGNPILTGNTDYMVRVWLKPDSIDSGLNFFAVFSSVSTGFTSTAEINGAGMSEAGSFLQASFSTTTPQAIPSDMLLSIYATAGTAGHTLLVDEISIIYSKTPYLDGDLFGSYGDNPEGIDGVTGLFGPVTDTRKVMDFGVLRETFYMLTQEPSGRLHETTDNGTTEPSGWTVNEVGANCGALSAFSLTKSQADDNAASGGEEWLAWASLSGARIFGGGYPEKISQEIQPDWANINLAAANTVFALNDPVGRALYFGVPMGSATAPSNLLFMSYRELDSANSIAASPPFRVSFTGHLIATDNSRKWSLWNMTMNGASLMYRSAGNLSVVLGGGNGLTPGVGGYGNAYMLNPYKYTDDDYGQVSSYYITYGFVNRMTEQQLGVGAHQKGFIGCLATVTWPAGTMLVQVAPNNPSNVWSLSCSRTISQSNIDLQWGYGGMIIARGERFFLKFSSVPIVGETDNAYYLQRLAVGLIPTRLKTRGAAQ